jgi:hypothetical protein
MNALDRRVRKTVEKLVSNKTITSEICYFKGMLDKNYIDVIRSYQDEQHMKLKIIIINEDMRKYMKLSYPQLNMPYNKENERRPIAELQHHNDIESEEEIEYKDNQQLTDYNNLPAG